MLQPVSVPKPPVVLLNTQTRPKDEVALLVQPMQALALAVLMPGGPPLIQALLPPRLRIGSLTVLHWLLSSISPTWQTCEPTKAAPLTGSLHLLSAPM